MKLSDLNVYQRMKFKQNNKKVLRLIKQKLKKKNFAYLNLLKKTKPI